MELTSIAPIPGTAKMFSITREPPIIPVNRPIRVFAIGIREFLKPWRVSACILDRPFVRASSRYSEFMFSISSARRYLAMVAIGPSASAMIGRTMEYIPPPNSGARESYSVGNSGIANVNVYCSRDANMKDGTEMKTTIRKEITVTPTDGTTPFTITMGGSIDRMDEKDGYLRIIDYKTGTHIQEARDMEQLFNTSEKERPYHIFQTFLYATLLSEETDKPITPALFYIQKAASADYSPTVKMSKQTVDDFTPLRKEYTEELNNLLSKIFSANNRFCQTTVSKRCTFCDFARICNR